MTPEELALEARRCADAGATIIHMHVRTKEGQHSLDPDLYRLAMEAVRAEIGERMVLQITTEAVGMYEPEQQMAVRARTQTGGGVSRPSRTDP